MFSYYKLTAAISTSVITNSENQLYFSDLYSRSEASCNEAVMVCSPGKAIIVHCRTIIVELQH